MKKLLICLVASGLAVAAYAGVESYSAKSSKAVQETQAAAFCEWYRDTEWNVSVWGAYAFTFNEWQEDRYFQMDHAWGGGIDAKYFFGRYFGLGLEGAGFFGERHVGVIDLTNETFTIEKQDESLGMIKGTFTFRWPIGCTRFAPYAYGGIGAIFGGGDSNFEFINIDEDEGDIIDIDDGDQDAELLGQIGGGLEIRITPNIGLINDFSWNIIDGTDNNFGMVRSGINFAF